MKRVETEIAVVGTGPAGATVARELALRNHKVVMVEKGEWHNRLIGRWLSMGTITRMERSREGGIMGRGITVGGSSVVFNGNAFEPPAWLESELGIDISKQTEKAKKETGVSILPEEFYRSWSATQRLVHCAGELNIILKPQPKFICAEKCDPRCDDCMFGCKRGGKWTARSYVFDALENGANIFESHEVERVIIKGGKAVGVKVKGKSNVEEIIADKVIISAGGMGTPIILRKSGINAGEGFFIDPMNVVLGVGKEKGTWREMTFSYATEELAEREGFLVGTVGAFIVWGAQLTRHRSLSTLLKATNLPKIMGMFTKIGDSPGGRIYPDGTVEKPYTEEDMEKFRKGTEICKKVLIRAGAIPESIIVAENIGGHPGGTSAIGKVVDKNLQVFGVDNLYVCDASVFPRSPGRPPTLTLIALGKRLAETIN